MSKNVKDRIIKELKDNGNKAFAEHHAKYFQTQKGGYGEGDIFFGLKVPQQRAIGKKYFKEISLPEIEELLKHKVHEVRFTALMILVEYYKNADKNAKKKAVVVYTRNAAYINNWDLVDLSAPFITGPYWFENPSADLWKFAKSKNLWKERIAMLSTLHNIRQENFSEVLKLAELFLTHKHDLMHKAAGWMLREAGKRDPKVLYSFLDKHHKNMPRTMLRYAIEKLSDKERKRYMGK